MSPLLLLSLLALAAPPSKGAGAQALFKSAIEDFEFGEHKAAAEKLRKLLEPPQLESKEDVIVARQYLGACYHLLDDKERAKAQFSMLLALDPNHKLDPEVFSPALVEFFEEVRTEAGLGLKGREEKKSARASAADGSGVKGGGSGSDAARAGVALPPRPNPPLALAFVPFGVGQFNNRQPVRGVLFGAGEVGLFATSVVSYAMFNGLKASGPCGPDPNAACFKNQDDANRASTLQTLYLVTFWSGLAVTAAGIIEALISYPGETETDAYDDESVSARPPRTGAFSLGGGASRYGLEIRF